MAKTKTGARMKVTVDESPRDFVMARLAAARSHAAAAVEAIDDAIMHWTDPSEDDDGTQRKEALEAALDELGSATRSAECAEETAEHADICESEPWEGDDAE